MKSLINSLLICIGSVENNHWCLVWEIQQPKMEGCKGWRWWICGVDDWYFWLKFRTNITVWQPITPHVFKITGLTIFEVQPCNFLCRQSHSMECPWPSHSWACYFLANRVGTDFSSLETWSHRPGDIQPVITDSLEGQCSPGLGWLHDTLNICRRPSKDLALCNMIWMCVCPPMSRLRQ